MVQITATVSEQRKVDIDLNTLQIAAKENLTPFKLVQAAYEAWKKQIGVWPDAFIDSSKFWQVYVNNGSHYSGDQDVRKKKPVTDEERSVDSDFKNLIAYLSNPDN